MSIWRFSGAASLAFGLPFSFACDESASCPADSCDPATDGVAFDVLDWCEASGECLRDGTRVPVCIDADASPAPSCALGTVDTGESLTFPVGRLRSELGGRQDLVVTYASCDDGSQPPMFEDVEILFDGTPVSCQAGNPCDPDGAPTVMACMGVPSAVQSITFSFKYDGAQGTVHLQVEMQDSACSYFCS